MKVAEKKPTAKAQQSAATRKALLNIARRQFAKRGYAAVSVEEIVSAAGVTKGALYHHFRGKEELFRAVVEQTMAEIEQSAIEAARGADSAMERLERGLSALLDAFLDPGTQRIVVLDSPAALGWEDWREINERYSLGQIRMALEAAMDAGTLERMPVDSLAHMLLGAMNDACCYIARSDDVDAARKQAGETMRRILSGLSA